VSRHEDVGVERLGIQRVEDYDAIAGDDDPAVIGRGLKT
jgi:hypothetical protein